MLPKKDILLLKHLLVNKKTDEIRSILTNLHPADIAQILADIKNGNQKLFFRLMDTAKAAEVLEEFEPAVRLTLLSEMTEAETIRILENMSVDEMIDMLQEMPNTEVERVLSKLPVEYYDELQSLLKLAQDTAGGLMTTDFVYIFSYVDVSQAIEDVRKFGHDAETIYYLYVVDDQKHLLGVLSLRELISAPRYKKIEEIMHKNVVSVDVGLDQEEVAKVISKYSLLAVPVVNEQKRLLGIVTVDDALEVMERESTEDIHKMAGIVPEEELMTSSVFVASRKRVFWLIICLIGDMLSGLVIKGYSHVLETVVAVAFFIPVLMATGGNVGTQSLALAVRGFATGELNKKNIFRFVGGETLAGLQIGVICGLILGAVAFIWQNDFRLGLAVGVSMCIALMLSAFIGIFVPIIFQILKIDPAIASGPFITTVVDVCVLLIYFAFSIYFMDQFSVGFAFVISHRIPGVIS
jgi:magnesium transporter